MEQMITLMYSSENKLIDSFRVVYAETFPNVASSFESPFKATAWSSDAKYYQKAIDCYTRVENLVRFMQKENLFETAYQKVNLQTAITSLRNHALKEYAECEVV
jgi:hypothetical protein